MTRYLAFYGDCATKLDDYSTQRIQVQPNGCWHWTVNINQAGYGVATRACVRYQAHRWVWVQLRGPIPDGLVLDHLCHNNDPDCPGGVCLHRRCVNPDHLEATTYGTNTRRGKTVLRANLAKETCPKGHPYDRVDARGWRKCRTCLREDRAAKRRAAGTRRLDEPTCPAGHLFDEANTAYQKATGTRRCRECMRQSQRERYWRLKEQQT